MEAVLAGTHPKLLECVEDVMFATSDLNIKSVEIIESPHGVYPNSDKVWIRVHVEGIDVATGRIREKTFPIELYAGYAAVPEPTTPEEKKKEFDRQMAGGHPDGVLVDLPEGVDYAEFTADTSGNSLAQDLREEREAHRGGTK